MTTKLQSGGEEGPLMDGLLCIVGMGNVVLVAAERCNVGFACSCSGRLPDGKPRCCGCVTCRTCKRCKRCSTTTLVTLRALLGKAVERFLLLL